MRNKRGFSLAELMVATAVLSFGLILVYEAFFITTDAALLMPHYMKTQFLISEMIWSAEASLMEKGYLAQGSEAGAVKLDRRRFAWRKETWAVAGTMDVYMVEVDFSWRSGGRTVTNSRTAYLRY